MSIPRYTVTSDGLQDDPHGFLARWYDVEQLHAEVERLTGDVERWARMYQHLADATERLRADLSKARTSAAMWERAHDILDESIDLSREHAQVEAVKREAFIERLAAAVERHKEVLAENARLTRERDDARKGWNEVLLEVERLTAELDEERGRHDRARAEVDVLLPPNPQFYMDPPDGGGVDRVEVVRRYIEHLRADLAAARAALDDAIECVESWAAYADAYFQQKHDLAGDLARLRAALPSTPEQEA